MRFRLPAALAIAMVSTAAGCGSSSSSNSSTTKHLSPTAAAVSQIKRNWVAFFSPKTPDAEKVSLLQNGSRFAPVIQAQSKSPLAALLKLQGSAPPGCPKG